MKRYYSYAGLNICIDGEEDILFKDELSLKAFRKEYLEDCEVFSFELVDHLKENSGNLIAHAPGFVEYQKEDTCIRYVGSVDKDVANAYMCIEQKEKYHEVSVLKSSIVDVIPLHTVYTAMQSERLMAKHNTIMFHASYIAYEGKAILFTAPSGTGKSTQASLWEKYRNIEIINGDRVAISKINDTYYACGVPFAGSSNISKNVTLPLGCIVCLAQDKQNKVKKIVGFEAFLHVYEGSGINTWDKNHVSFISSFVENICKELNVLKLECTPTKEAVDVLDAYLRKEKLW